MLVSLAPDGFDELFLIYRIGIDEIEVDGFVAAATRDHHSEYRLPNPKRLLSCLRKCQLDQ